MLFLEESECPTTGGMDSGTDLEDLTIVTSWGSFDTCTHSKLSSLVNGAVVLELLVSEESWLSTDSLVGIYYY